MAVVLKEGETYRSTMSETLGADVTTSSAYGIVGQLEIDNSKKELVFVIAIYGSKEARDEQVGTIDNVPVRVTGEVFDSMMNAGGILSQCYQLAMSNEQFAQFKSDET